jgi:hypothetical protein
MRSTITTIERSSGGGYVLLMRGQSLQYFRDRRAALIFAWKILIGSNPCR